MHLLIAAAAAVVITLPTVARVKVALSGDNTKITFVGTKPGGKHEGGFKSVKGGAVVSADGVSKVAVEIDMESLFSDDPKLTAHLKSPDFFGVKTNPKSKFESTKIEKTEKGHSITGDLTLNGKTKEISFPATITASGSARSRLRVHSRSTSAISAWNTAAARSTTRSASKSPSTPSRVLDHWQTSKAAESGSLAR